MDVLTSLIAAVLFYALPFLIGRSLVKMLYKKPISYPWVSYFVTGALVTYMSLVLTYYTVSFFTSSVTFLPIMYGVTGLLAFIFVPANILVSKIDTKNWKSIFIPSTVSLACTAIVYGVWQWKSPLPFNWDIFEHQLLANKMLTGKFSFFTSQISDTFGFNGYSTFFHTLLAASQQLGIGEVFTYHHILAIMHASIVGLASFLLAKELTGKKLIAYLTLILSTLTFDSSVSYSTLFVIPQTFTASVFALLIAQVVANEKKNFHTSWILMTGGVIFLLLNHYIIGIVAAGMYAATALYFRYKDWIHTKLNVGYMLQITLFTALIAALLSPALRLDTLNHGEAADYTLSTLQKFDISRQVYGFMLLLFAPLGAAHMIQSKKRGYILALTGALLLFTLILMDLPYILKFYVLARPFIHIVMAVGIAILIYKIKNHLLRGIAFIGLVATLLVILVTNAASWKELLRYHNTFTNVSENEVKAAEFVKKKYKPGDTTLISDPATQHIFEMLSGVNTQGGAYMSHTTRQILDNVSKSKNPQEKAKLLYKISDKFENSEEKRIFIASGRYFLWQKSTEKDKDALSYNIWYPADLNLENELIVENLTNSNNFDLIYKNATVAIFEVNY